MGKEENSYEKKTVVGKEEDSCGKGTRQLWERRQLLEKQMAAVGKDEGSCEKGRRQLWEQNRCGKKTAVENEENSSKKGSR